MNPYRVSSPPPPAVEAVEPFAGPRPRSWVVLSVYLLGFALPVALVNCRGSDVVNPPTGPNTSYPCGVWGVACSNGACCPWAHICGGPNQAGFSRCAEGYCCADGDPFYGAARTDAGEPLRSMPQRRPDGAASSRR